MKHFNIQKFYSFITFKLAIQSSIDEPKYQIVNIQSKCFLLILR